MFDFITLKVISQLIDISNNKNKLHNSGAYCALERIRTPNPRSRNPIFYPVELRMHL